MARASTILGMILLLKSHLKALYGLSEEYVPWSLAFLKRHAQESSQKMFEMGSEQEERHW
jgi:hypothetical protein